MKKNKAFFWQRKIFPHTRGSFLADVLVSLFVIMTSISIGYSIIGNAFISHSFNKNKIIALNLAREGIESIRLIRDTNWIKYGTKKRICWNYWNNTDEDDQWDPTVDITCTEESNTGQNNHPIGITNDGTRIKSYISVLDPINYDWTLVENFYQIDIAPAVDMNGNLPTWSLIDLSDGGSQILWEARKTTANGVTSQLYIDNITKLYTHNQKDENGTDNIPTRFYREIYIEYPTNIGDNKFFPLNIGVAPSLENTQDNQIMVTTKVWYPSVRGHYSSLIIETELTDHYGRSNWNE